MKPSDIIVRPDAGPASPLATDQAHLLQDLIGQHDAEKRFDAGIERHALHPELRQNLIHGAVGGHDGPGGKARRVHIQNFNALESV